MINGDEQTMVCAFSLFVYNFYIITLDLINNKASHGTGFIVYYVFKINTTKDPVRN